MRLVTLTVGAFGRLRPGLTLEPADGLNLIHAPNEAGKTTLVELIVGLLYGFGRRRKGVHPYQPWSATPQELDMEVGGELTCRLDDGRTYTIARHLRKGRKHLVVRDQHGQEVDLGHEEVGRSLLGLERGAFLTVCRIQLDDLKRAFSEASPAQLKRYFFQEAATRGQVRNPVEVLAAWRRAADGLYSRDRRKGRQDRTLCETIASARDELAAARARQQEAEELAGEGKEVQRRLAEVQAELERARRACEQARARRERGAQIARQRELAAELAALEAQGLAHEATEQQARDLKRELDQAQARLQEVRRRLQAAREQAAEASGGRAPQALEQTVAELRPRLEALKAREQELAARRQRLEQRAAELQTQYGRPPGELSALPRDLPQTLEDLQRRKEEAEREQNQATRTLESLPPAPSAWPLALGLAGVGLGLTALVLAALLAWDKPGWLAGAVLLAAGLALSTWGWSRRGRARHLARERARCSADRDLARQRAQDLEQQRQDALTAADIPPHHPLARPTTLAAAQAQAQAWHQEDQALRQDQQALDRERSALAHHLRQAGSPPAAETTPELETALAALARRAAEAQRASAAVQDLQAQLTTLEKEVQAKDRALAELLRTAGLEGLEALDRARERARRAEALRAELKALAEALGTPGEEAGASPEELAQAVGRAEAAVKALEVEERRLQKRHGEIEEGLRRLAGAVEVAQVEEQVSALEGERLELARRQAVFHLGAELLSRAMDRFRLEAQPSLMRRAGEYLARATAGTYGWLGSDIFEPAEREPRLVARRGGGTAECEAEALSRGTRDQLYLCLRLALADEITAGGETLPLILDDPLVNFDDRRLEETLRLLVELAGRRQVLLLTCHRQQYELLRGMGDCRLLSLD